MTHTARRNCPELDIASKAGGQKSLVRRVLDYLAFQERRYRDARRLSELPDYLLDDVGLDRDRLKMRRRVR
ncbi:DUF1127 domain-containing protein [Rhodobacterales bacterium]|nr:DUF1127 domain-containing protein [Rhodobacterales bacterium]